MTGNMVWQSRSLCSCQTPHSSPCTHSSLVCKGFSSPPPLIKIPQLLLWVVSLTYCKSKTKQKNKGKKICVVLQSGDEPFILLHSPRIVACWHSCPLCTPELSRAAHTVPFAEMWEKRVPEMLTAPHQH